MRTFPEHVCQFYRDVRWVSFLATHPLMDFGAVYLQPSANRALVCIFLFCDGFHRHPFLLKHLDPCFCVLDFPVSSEMPSPIPMRVATLTFKTVFAFRIGGHSGASVVWSSYATFR